VPAIQGRRQAGIDEHSFDLARQPAAFEAVEPMTVGAAQCKGPVGRQAMAGRVYATPTVSLALSFHRRVASARRMMPGVLAGRSPQVAVDPSPKPTLYLTSLGAGCLRIKAPPLGGGCCGALNGQARGGDAGVIV
jgi:hypothetical protein